MASSLDQVTVVKDDALAKQSPHVSVCIVTYNQVDMIGEAIDSAIRQDTDFAYEIIVGDDCSTDGTREVLRTYQRAYPGLIRLNLHEEHYDGITARKNMVTNLESARGRYVALLDGDDFWISTDKLQKQTSYLDAHPGTALSFHNAEYRYRDAAALERHKERAASVPRGGSYFSERFSDVLSEDCSFNHNEMIAWRCARDKFSVPASSVMFRRSLFTPVPEWFWEVYYADKIMQMYLSEFGAARYHSDILSCRRFTAGSVSTRQQTLAETNLIIQESHVMQEVCSSYQAHGPLSACYLWQMRYWLERSRYGNALRCLVYAMPNYFQVRARQGMRWLTSFSGTPSP